MFYQPFITYLLLFNHFPLTPFHFDLPNYSHFFTISYKYGEPKMTMKSLFSFRSSKCSTNCFSTMPISSLFQSNDPYQDAVPNPQTGLSQPTQVRLPGVLLITHSTIRGGIIGTFSGLSLGLVAAGTKNLTNGLLAGGGRLGFIGLCTGSVVGIGAAFYRAATDNTFDDEGVRLAGNSLFHTGQSIWPMFTQDAYLQGKIDKWSLGGAMGAAMAGFQAKRPLDASRCVPWGVALAMVAIKVTEEIELAARRNKRSKESEM